MFSRLKLKLTIINVAVVILIFIVVFTGIYYTMSKSITNQSSQQLDMITLNIVGSGGPLNLKLLSMVNMQPYIIVVLSNSGEILNYNGSTGKDTLTNQKAEELVAAMHKALSIQKMAKKSTDANSDTTGKAVIAIDKMDSIILHSGETYRSRIVKTPDNSISMVFINIDYEQDLINSLRLNLIGAALIGLGLVFCGSLFMAGRAIKPIKISWERQRDFTADASHELRTPLSVIQSNLELVMDNKEETVESQYKWLENIYTENKRMTRLVGDLLLLARADSGQTLLEIKNFSLSAALEDAVAPFIPVADIKNIKIDTRIEPAVNFTGDEARIKQLAIILIDNAIKYTSPGGSVSLQLINNDDSLDIIVNDTGEGISKEHIDKIFERFYRVDKARSREDGGTGLGLSIASWIVKEHRGTIRAASEPGYGSTFTVTFQKSDK